jgi:hypothetical protein
MCRLEKHEASQVSWRTGRDLYLEHRVPLRIAHATPITSVVCKLLVFTYTDAADKLLCGIRLLMHVSWVTGYV